jgi:hypothetical protein
VRHPIPAIDERDREGSTDGLYVAAWESHKEQRHNHNDVGNVIVYVDGAPVFVDAGITSWMRTVRLNRGRHVIVSETE